MYHGSRPRLLAVVTLVTLVHSLNMCDITPSAQLASLQCSYQRLQVLVSLLPTCYASRATAHGSAPWQTENHHLQHHTAAAASQKQTSGPDSRVLLLLCLCLSTICQLDPQRARQSAGYQGTCDTNKVHCPEPTPDLGTCAQRNVCGCVSAFSPPVARMRPARYVVLPTAPQQPAYWHSVTDAKVSRPSTTTSLNWPRLKGNSSRQNTTFTAQMM